MIAFLTGKLRMAGLNYVVVDAGGVGYRVSVPLSLMAQMPVIGEAVELFVHTQVREDAIQLFGFPALQDQELFEALIGVQGVGPKVALSIMSVLPSDQITQAIASDDAATLQRVPGVGGKTALRVVLELKDKMAELTWERRTVGARTASDTEGEALKDAVEALMALGYNRSQARSAADKVAAMNGAVDVASIVRAALNVLTSR
jgi:holliday junction DNA helicase RuvA